MMSNYPGKVGVVGPCAAGKSTLVEGLEALGYRAKNIAQEHSYAPGMWERITHPDLLIFLDVSYEVSLQRKPLNWNWEEYTEQQRRLAHARQHASLYLHTDHLSIKDVLARVEEFIRSKMEGTPSPPPQTGV